MPTSKASSIATSKPQTAWCEETARSRSLISGSLVRRQNDSQKITRSESANKVAVGGTPAYMAPEVLRGQPANERSDLWALGVVLYEMASGGRPYEGATGYQIASSILTVAPKPLPPTIPSPPSTIINRLLEKDPALRYRTAGEVSAALSTLRDADRRDVRGVARVPLGTGRWPSRRAIGIGAAASALVIVGMLWFWWIARDRSVQLDSIELLSTFDGLHSAPALAPDGDFVAFVAADSEGVPQIWVKNLAEGAPVQITSGPIAADRPRWHPNGSAVVFARRGQGIWLVPALGGTARRLVEQGVNPNFSRDGARLTWETPAGISVAAADGSGARVVAGVPPRYYTVGAAEERDARSVRRKHRKQQLAASGRWPFSRSAETDPISGSSPAARN